jgi:hypothetical protein
LVRCSSSVHQPCGAALCIQAEVGTAILSPADHEEEIVAELVDYSGPFDPQWSPERLSKEALLKLVKAYSEYIYRIDATWYMAVKNRWGNDEAFACDCGVWEKKLQPYELKLMTRVLGIRGDDVVAVMKYMQATPWASVDNRVIDIKNHNHAVMTIHNCPTLSALEKEGAGREKLICGDLTTSLFSKIAHYFNPNIKVTGLKVPPRTTYTDCCCQWEFRLDR